MHQITELQQQGRGVDRRRCRRQPPLPPCAPLITQSAAGLWPCSRSPRGSAGCQLRGKESTGMRDVDVGCWMPRCRRPGWMSGECPIGAASWPGASGCLLQGSVRNCERPMVQSRAALRLAAGVHGAGACSCTHGQNGWLASCCAACELSISAASSRPGGRGQSGSCAMMGQPRFDVTRLATRMAGVNRRDAAAGPAAGQGRLDGPAAARPSSITLM